MEKKHVSKQKKHNDIDDAFWAKIENYFPRAKRKRKYKLKDVFNACLFIDRTGIQWRNLPEQYPPYRLVFFHFSKWKKKLIFGINYYFMGYCLFKF